MPNQSASSSRVSDESASTSYSTLKVADQSWSPDGRTAEYQTALDDQQATSSWFAGLKNRIAAIVMPEWLSSLGEVGVDAAVTPRVVENDVPTTSNDYESAIEGIAVRQRKQRSPASVGRSQSEQPPNAPPLTLDYYADSLKSMSLEPDGRTPSESDAKRWAVFWDNLAPGTNYHDTLELQHFGPLVQLRNAAARLELGVGHDFLSEHLMHPTWCDKCGDFIWGFVRQALRCKHCNYTCHYKCRSLVTLDCAAVLSTDEMSDASWHTATSEELALIGHKRRSTAITDFQDAVSGTADITDLTSLSSEKVDGDWSAEPSSHTVNGEALRDLVQEYNADCNGLAITVHEDNYAYYGYVQVHMNFGRPISIVASEEGATVFDVMGNGGTQKTIGQQSIHSFYLPRNTVKTLYVDSTTCTREMIVALLRKFRVADNPRKFALYMRCACDTQAGKTLMGKVTRISDDDFPLRIALRWGAKTSNRFVLQENETGDILWDHFEIPELNNFIKILDIEQAQYMDQIRKRYEAYKLYVRAEMVQRGLSNKIMSSSFSCYQEGPTTPTKESVAATLPLPPVSDDLPNPSRIVRRATTHASSTASSNSMKYATATEWQGEDDGDRTL